MTILSTAGLCKELRRSPATIYRWHKAGWIPFFTREGSPYPLFNLELVEKEMKLRNLKRGKEKL